jgi:hypothetical protein
MTSALHKLPHKKLLGIELEKNAERRDYFSRKILRKIRHYGNGFFPQFVDGR